MKVSHNAQIDYLTIDFTDSLKLFSSSDLLTLQESCKLLGISESTMRRRIKSHKIKFTKEGKDYRFKKN